MSYIGNEPIVSATRTVTEITATAGQTVFTANGGYTVGYIDVFVNGAQLTASDFTATNGSTITLNEAATVNDIVRLVAWGTFQTSSALTANNPSYTGTLTGGTGVVNIGSGQIFKDTSGNVGIGTSSPSFPLQVSSGTSGNISFMVNPPGLTNFAVIPSNSGSTGTRIGTTGGDTFAFITNNTERMRITSGGTLCVGTTNEDSSRANIVHSGTPSRVLRVGAESGSFTGTMYEGYGARTTTNGTYKLIEVLNGNASGLFRVLDSGNAQNTNNSYGGTSDIKLKENIVDATPKLVDLCKVKVRHYNFKSKPDEKQIGVVAQELEEVFAGLVEETADKDKDGNDLGTTTKSVKYSVFVPMLIKAIQELKTIVDNQKIELDNAKAEIELLKGAN